MSEKLAEKKLRIPALTGDSKRAADEFIQAAFQTRDRATGAKHGVQYAEEFHYVGPDRSLEDYIRRNAAPL